MPRLATGLAAGTDACLTDVRQQGRWYPHPVDGRRVHHLGTMDDPVLAHRPPRSDQQRTIEIVSYDPTWPRLFRKLGATLRGALGDVAVRIDHIGSTSVPGMAAKPIIDVQISVRSFQPLEAFKQPLERLGYVYRADNTERTKRYFREPPGSRRTHIHVRRAGSFSEQWALLFRDYLRTQPEVGADYIALKRRLAAQFPHNGAAYTDAKGPFLWEVIRRADGWAQAQGWMPGPTDA